VATDQVLKRRAAEPGPLLKVLLAHGWKVERKDADPPRLLPNTPLSLEDAEDGRVRLVYKVSSTLTLRTESVQLPSQRSKCGVLVRIDGVRYNLVDTLPRSGA